MADANVKNKSTIQNGGSNMANENVTNEASQAKSVLREVLGVAGYEF